MKRKRAENILFPSGGRQLDGMLTRGNLPRGVVISHPHPLYGGDMHNTVVDLISRAFEEKGWTTLRFNFRGVGRSGGKFDQGLGEQADVRAAVAYLKELLKGPVVLAGYSFGAGVNARAALDHPDILYSILVSPPVSMMEFSFLKTDSKTSLIIAGDRDPFCPVAELRKTVREMKALPTIKIIEGADHFYSSGASELIDVIQKRVIEEE